MPVNGLVVMTPTSIASTGTGNSSSINADGSVDFASCATLSLNGVFTSSYDNYMIVMRCQHNATTSDIRLRFRVGGVDNSTASSYVSQYIFASATTVSGVRSTQNYGIWGATSNTQRDGNALYLFGPYLAQPTAFRSTNVYGTSSGSLIDYAGTHNQSTAYDGLTFSLSDLTSITGAVTVYGFNQ